MATRDARQPSSDLFILVIFIVVLVDAVLTAHVRVNFLQDHGYDLFPQRPVVTRPTLP